MILTKKLLYRPIFDLLIFTVLMFHQLFYLSQALNFSLDGKLSLCDLTTALENELLVAKNGIHQAALASFKAEIKYLL